MVKETYPLQWPTGWPRNPRRSYSNFKTSKADAKKGLIRELGLLGARDIVITSDVARRKDGLERLDRREPLDIGVAVWFTLRGEERCIPCDKWSTLADNLHAIELTVAALRGLERWGAKEMVNAAFLGFAALPVGSTGADAWWQVLEVDPGASSDEIERAYRLLARSHHPDTGGDVAAFQRLVTAYQDAKANRP